MARNNKMFLVWSNCCKTVKISEVTLTPVKFLLCGNPFPAPEACLPGPGSIEVSTMRVGLYWRLKDPQTNWKDRVKLARYAWMHESVVLANKEQTLLDWACTSLTGKNRVHQDEAEPVWKFLHDVLQTRKVHKTGVTGHALFLKPTIAQVLIEELSGLGTGEASSRLQLLIECCSAILTSPVFAHTFTARFDYMVQLMKVALLVNNNCVSMTTQVSSMLSLSQKFLITVMDRYIVVQRQRPTAKEAIQQVCAHLLVPSAFCIFHNQDKKTTVAKLKELLFAALFHKELTDSYAQFLKRITQTNEPLTGTQNPKFILCIFEELSKALKGKGVKTDEQKPVMEFLTHFYEGFLCHSRFDNTAMMGFRLFIHLFNLVTDTCEAGSGTVPVNVAIDTLGHLLQVVEQHGSYRLSLDSSPSINLGQWLGKCLQWLLDHQQNPDAAWFRCMEMLLKLNYSTAEQHLPKVLRHSWVPLSDETTEITEARNSFLCELVNIYSKLRRVQKLVGNMLNAIKDGGSKVRLTASPEFMSRLGTCFEQLSQWESVEIWSKIMESVKDLVHSITEVDHQQLALDGVTNLLCCFLENVRLCDQNITHQVALQAQKLMEQTQNEVLQPLLIMCADKEKIKQIGQACLCLVHSWVHLHIVLRQYTGFHTEGAFLHEHGAQHQSDLTFVCPAVDAAGWQRVFIRVQKLGRKVLHLLLQMICMQKLRALLLFGGKNESSVQTSLQSTVAFLMVNDLDVSTMDTSVSWDGQVSSLTKETHTVAQWQLMTRNLAFLSNCCSQVQLLDIARYLVMSMVKANKEDAGCGSLHSVSNEFLTGNVFPELRSFQPFVITAVLEFLSQTLSGKPRSKKMKVQATCIQTATAILRQLSNTDTSDWDQILREKGKKLGMLLGEPGSANQVELAQGQLHKMYACFQILKSLPLEYLSQESQARLLLGLVSLLVACRSYSNEDKRQPIGKECCDIMAAILDGSHGTESIFTYIGSGQLLQWLIENGNLLATRGQLETVVSGLMKIACRAPQWAASLHPLIEWSTKSLREIINKIKTKEKPVEGAGNQNVLTGTVWLLKALAKVLARVQVYEDIRASCQNFLNTMMDNFCKVLQSYIKRKQLHHSRITESVFLEGFSCVLGYCCRTQEKDAEMLKLVAPMCALCKEILSGADKHHSCLSSRGFPSDSLEVRDVTKRAASSTSSAAGVRQLRKSAEAINLNQELAGRDYVKEGDSEVNVGCEDELATLKSCLYFIQTLCSNHGHVCELLPESYIMETWTLVVNVQRNLHKWKSRPQRTLIMDHRQELDPGNLFDCKAQDDTNSSSSFLKDIIEVMAASQASYREKLSSDHTEEVAHGTVLGKVDEKFISGSPSKLKAFGRGTSQHTLDENAGKSENDVIAEKVVEIEKVLHVTMATIVSVADTAQLQRMMVQVVEQVKIHVALRDPGQTTSALQVWQRLLQMNYEEEHLKLLNGIAQTMLIQLQAVVQECNGMRDQYNRTEMVSMALQVQADMLASSLLLWSPQNVALCLHSCQAAPLSGQPLQHLVSIYHGIYEVLNAALVHHGNTVHNFIPAFISAFKRLIVAAILEGHQGHDRNEVEVHDLCGCAHLVDRMCGLISAHHIDFNKVAAYLVADYVSEVQKVTLLPAVKRALLPGIYKLLDICDEFAIAQLHTVLSPGVREIFKTIYADYTKYHKYSGRV